MPAAAELKVLENFGVGNGVFVRALAVDPAHQTLWVGTSLGAHEVDLKTYDLRNTYTRKAGLANEYVFAAHVDRAGGAWFGTNGGGTSVFKDGQWRTYFPMHGLADYWVYSFGEQRDGTLWIGTWAGVSRKRAGEDVFQNYVKELVNEWVYGVAVDERDRVWLGTEGGVSMFDGQTWRSWSHQEGVGAPNKNKLPTSPNTGLGTRARHDLSLLNQGQPTYNPGYVFCIKAIAEDHSIWVGTWGGGVSRFDGQNWKSYTQDDGLAGNVVFSMVREPSGVWWFGTDQGLSRFDGRQWRTFTREDGLMGNAVYALALSPDGQVWAGSQGGVVRIGKPSAAPTGAVSNGIKTPPMNSPAENKQ